MFDEKYTRKKTETQYFLDTSHREDYGREPQLRDPRSRGYLQINLHNGNLHFMTVLTTTTSILTSTTARSTFVYRRNISYLLKRSSFCQTFQHNLHIFKFFFFEVSNVEVLFLEVLLVDMFVSFLHRKQCENNLIIQNEPLIMG